MQKRTLLPIAILLGLSATAAFAGGRATGTHPDPEQVREAAILGQPPRIAPLADIPDDLKALAAPPKGFGKPGDVPQMFAILLRNPELARRFIPMASYFITAGKLPARDRELVILRDAWMLRAPYEWGEHVAVARKIGMTGEEIGWIRKGSTAPGWNDHDRAMLKAVEELSGNAMISDATWAALAKGLSDEQLLEVPVLVGQYKTIAYLQNALRMELRPGNRGLAAR